VVAFPGVGRLVAGRQVPPLRPAGGRGGFAVGQRQPGVQRGDRVEQRGGGWAGAGSFGLGHRRPRPGRVAFGVPDPGQGSQPGGQGPGFVELPAQRQPGIKLPAGGGQVAALVAHLGDAHVPDPGHRGRHAAGQRGDLQQLLVSRQGGVQVPLAAPDLAEVVAAQGGHDVPPGGLPPGDGGGEVLPGVAEPAAQPVRVRQVQPAERLQQPVAIAQPGPGLGVEPRDAAGVAAQVGEPGPGDRDRGRHVGDQARARAHRRPEGVIGPGRVRPRAVIACSAAPARATGRHRRRRLLPRLI
jgi:hypothetical protein